MIQDPRLRGGFPSLPGLVLCRDYINYRFSQICARALSRYVYLSSNMISIEGMRSGSEKQEVQLKLVGAERKIIGTYYLGNDSCIMMNISDLRLC